MTGIRLVDDVAAAAALAELLNADSRRLPLVVVTTPHEGGEPWIDVEAVARDTEGLAEVYLMTTGPCTWEFTDRMAPSTDVFGGAGRAYPVGHDWVSQPRRAPLFVVHDAEGGRRATDRLIEAVLGMAASGRPIESRPRTAPRLRGRVGALVSGRGLVDVGRSRPAVLVPEETVPGIPAERLITEGQELEGAFDTETRRFDVRAALRGAAEAFADLSVGELLPVEVLEVEEHRARMLVYPALPDAAATTAVVASAEVTTNPLDDLRSLLQPGEVVVARVLSGHPEWSLRLSDVDDDEPVREAPSLLPGGPPWIAPAAAPVRAEEASVAVQGVDGTAATPADRDRAEEASESGSAQDDLAPTTAPPPGSPQSAAEGKRAADASGRTLIQQLQLRITTLDAAANRLSEERDLLREELGFVQAELDERERELRRLRDRDGRLRHRLDRAEDQLRRSRSSVDGNGADRPRFADREAGFRYQVLGRWATRILPSEQPTRPLGEYLLGAEFLDSVDRLEGVSVDKIVDVVVEIVTGLAPSIAGREVHQLRTGDGGADPVRVRASDGATAWRASLQVNTPSARRIHYWRRPDGVVEFINVSTHDDIQV